MGGYGSGRRTDRPSTDACIRINLAEMKRWGMLQRYCTNRRERIWTVDGEVLARLTIVADTDCLEPHPCLKITGTAFRRRTDCLVLLESVALPLGGERWYALSPKTGRRCAVLLLPPGAASVKGWRMPYSSQCGCEVHRAYRAIDKAQDRFRRLSKYARKPTKARLRGRIEAKHQVIDDELERLAALIRRGYKACLLSGIRLGLMCPLLGSKPGQPPEHRGDVFLPGDGDLVRPVRRTV